MTIKKQPWGEKIIIYIEADSPEEAEEKFYWFWHYSIASSLDSANWITYEIVSFFTTPEKYLKGVAEAHLARLLNKDAEHFKGREGGALPVARKYAQEDYDSLEGTTGYKAKTSRVRFFGYDSNHGKAENLTDTDA